MKRFSTVLLILAISLLAAGNIFSQESKASYYTITTWKIQVPEDGSRKEFLDMMKEWHTKVTLKNSKILSERSLLHQSGNDMRDFVLITEYASWNDIEAASEEQGKLVEAGWPDKEKRKAFFDRFWQYAKTHSDEIFRDDPALRK
ncbi:MAG: hypothetical protein Kow0037_04810 [Calditrichia bacterium]